MIDEAGIVEAVNTARWPWREPSVPRPTPEAIRCWMADGAAEATDGCWPVEVDGFCGHRHPSWPLYLYLA